MTALFSQFKTQGEINSYGLMTSSCWISIWCFSLLGFMAVLLFSTRFTLRFIPTESIIIHFSCHGATLPKGPYWPVCAGNSVTCDPRCHQNQLFLLLSFFFTLLSALFSSSRASSTWSAGAPWNNILSPIQICSQHIAAILLSSTAPMWVPT